MLFPKACTSIYGFYTQHVLNMKFNMEGDEELYEGLSKLFKCVMGFYRNVLDKILKDLYQIISDSEDTSLAIEYLKYLADFLLYS